MMFAMLALAAAAANATPAPADPLDKIRCVRPEVTGSLTPGKKICHTLREWRTIQNAAEAEARRVANAATGNASN